MAPPATTGQRLKRIGKSVAEMGAGAAPAIGGAEAGAGIGGVVGGPVGAAVGGVIGGAAGGLLSPSAEQVAAGAMGVKKRFLRRHATL